MEDIDLPAKDKFFINKNLGPCYKVVWSKSKMAFSFSKINDLFILGDTIKIKVSENSLPLSIPQVDDFRKYFPDIDLSPPKRSV